MNYIDKGATFSTDGKHRFSLWRKVGQGEKMVLFIGLNPSTADAVRDDPTVRRCMGFARDWGFDRLYMGNLFSFVTSKPEELTLENTRVYEIENREWLLKMAKESQLIILAWGTHGNIRYQGENIAQMLRQGGLIELACFGINKNGTPKHPLYLPKSVKLERW